MTIAPMRQFLRNETSEAHSALDRLVGPFSCLEDYQAYLEGSARFRLPLEAALAASPLPEALGQWRPGLIGPDIAGDLADLHMPPPLADADAPSPERLEDWLGVLYVLEGSSLGARLLAKRAAALGLSEAYGARHLFSQSGNFSNWHAFLNILEGVRTVDRKAVSDWAVRTFNFAYSAYESSMECRLPQPSI
ncbi:biliverdin-producing heme oxygenase [Rhizobium paknamense]|uniref:Heme oxygenase n=1 Tax=Rhizobium paknamense TaxID=1206817 RepID=A0ABU0IFV6_9HYPH|nr:biliverdin-producing heme oxygenase [Rhizobium paknamense]MDQ0457142.1 heme oxygenase [Rhizobium paknamense]